MADPDSSYRALWLAELLDRYERPLVRYVARISGDLDCARDVVQDVFVQLCRTDPNTIRGNTAAWLYKACRNRAIDSIRRQRHLRLADELLDLTPGPEAPPAAGLEQREAAGLLLSAVGSLSDDQQEVLLLRFQGGLSYKQIADVTGHTHGNVGVLLHEALRNLRERLGRQRRSARRKSS